MARACKTVTTRFKTKRGKTVTFKSREGDACRPKAATSAQKTQRREFAAAGRACFKSLGKKAVGTKRFGACMRSKLK